METGLSTTPDEEGQGQLAYRHRVKGQRSPLHERKPGGLEAMAMYQAGRQAEALLLAETVLVSGQGNGIGRGHAAWVAAAVALENGQMEAARGLLEIALREARVSSDHGLLQIVREMAVLAADALETPVLTDSERRALHARNLPPIGALPLGERLRKAFHVLIGKA